MRRPWAEEGEGCAGAGTARPPTLLRRPGGAGPDTAAEEGRSAPASGGDSPPPAVVPGEVPDVAKPSPLDLEGPSHAGGLGGGTGDVPLLGTLLSHSLIIVFALLYAGTRLAADEGGSVCRIGGFKVGTSSTAIWMVASFMGLITDCRILCLQHVCGWLESSK